MNIQKAWNKAAKKRQLLWCFDDEQRAKARWPVNSLNVSPKCNNSLVLRARAAEFYDTARGNRAGGARYMCALLRRFARRILALMSHEREVDVKQPQTRRAKTQKLHKHKEKLFGAPGRAQFVACLFLWFEKQQRAESLSER